MTAYCPSCLKTRRWRMTVGERELDDITVTANSNWTAFSSLLGQHPAICFSDYTVTVSTTVHTNRKTVLTQEEDNQEQHRFVRLNPLLFLLCVFKRFVFPISQTTDLICSVTVEPVTSAFWTWDVTSCVERLPGPRQEIILSHCSNRRYLLTIMFVSWTNIWATAPQDLSCGSTTTNQFIEKAGSQNSLTFEKFAKGQIAKTVPASRRHQSLDQAHTL